MFAILMLNITFVTQRVKFDMAVIKVWCINQIEFLYTNVVGILGYEHHNKHDIFFNMSLYFYYHEVK